jgi:thiazole synthase
VDVGAGTASDAPIATELDANGILINTAIAAADDAGKMSIAMKLAIEAGRLAYKAGRMPKTRAARRLNKLASPRHVPQCIHV